MSVFEFLMVLVSLIIGLGVTELLTGVARAIRCRATLKPYWVHGIFVVIIFLALLQQWWEVWGLRDVAEWSFHGLVLMLGAPILLFLIAHLMFPSELEHADLRTYYYDAMRPIFLVAMLTVLVAVLMRPIVIGTPLLEPDNLSSLVMLLVLGALWFTQAPAFHGAMAVVMLAALLLDIFVWNPRIS